MSIVRQRIIWFSISGLLVAGSIIAFFVYGLNLGVDFKGGSLLEVGFTGPRPTNQQITDSLAELNLGPITAQPIGETDVVIRFKEIDEAQHQAVLTTLQKKFGDEDQATKEVTEVRFDSVGPAVGQELRTKTVYALGIVLLAIIVYIAWAFRKVSKPVASWVYGLIAIITLFHDIIITVGAFVILGKLYGLEVNAPFVAALLTILGYSVNDTIVIFDRTRENLIRRAGQSFESIVDASLNEVITRSINASMTVLLVLMAILIFGGSSIRDFVLTLIVGVAIGAYSSIFLAAPLLVSWQKFRERA